MFLILSNLDTIINLDTINYVIARKDSDGVCYLKIDFMHGQDPLVIVYPDMKTMAKYFTEISLIIPDMVRTVQKL